MRKTLPLILLLAVFAGAGEFSAHAQTILKDYSARQARQWTARRAVAESIAAVNRIPIRSDLPDGRTFELQAFVNGVPRAFTTMNLNSARTISTDKVWPGGGYGFSLSGSTEVLGEWDAGSPLTTHQEYTGRILSTQNTVNGHSTHVAGTLIATGVQANAHGMSFQASLQCYDWDNDVAEMAAAAALGLHVSNHSYGLITGWYYNYFSDGKWVWFGDTTISGTQDYRFGFYDDEARQWDSLAFVSPFLLIDKAAGNDRGEGPTSQPVTHWIFNSLGQNILSNTVRDLDGGATGYNTLNGASTSKNVLVVGAVNDIVTGYQQPSDVVMSTFSCWGPTDDGRVKPDIVANGVNLYSSYSLSNTSYATLSGTSMATPSVTGSVGLLLQHQRNLHGSAALRSSTLRALLIHTADDAGNPGPDYQFGWGLMNTLHAAQLMSKDSADGAQSHIMELQLNQSDTITLPVYSYGAEPIKITLCWIDPPGTSPAPALNPTNIMLVNDLDLRLTYTGDQSAFEPWVLDPSNPSAPATTGDNVRDNVEQISLPSPFPGIYLARITHKGTLAGGSQKFSLIVTGNVQHFLTTAPDKIHITTNPGTTAVDSLTVRNSGTAPLSVKLTTHTSWLVADTIFHPVPASDSIRLPVTADATLIGQWTTLTDTLVVTSDDTIVPAIHIPVLLSTEGPKISANSSLGVETDSSLIASTGFRIRNVGTMALHCFISRSDSTPPSWLTVVDDSVVVGQADSQFIHLSVDARTLSPGSYSAHLAVASNDSSTGTVPVELSVTVYSSSSVQARVNAVWNMVSVPLTDSNRSAPHLFPGSISPAFAYAGAYVIHDSLTPGIGYWMRFPSAQDVYFNGTRIMSESLAVSPGWNLIGSLSLPIAVSTITSEPPGMATSKFYGYTGGYATSDSIIPGRGYWVKVDTSGVLILDANPSLIAGNRIQIDSHGEIPPPPPESGGSAEVRVPREYSLSEAYPNPFNPSTTIRYQLPALSHVTLVIYNLLGQKLQVLVDETQDAGYKQAVWNAANYSSGIFFCRIDAVRADDPHGRFIQVRKLVLLR